MKLTTARLRQIIKEAKSVKQATLSEGNTRPKLLKWNIFLTKIEKGMTTICRHEKTHRQACLKKVVPYSKMREKW